MQKCLKWDLAIVFGALLLCCASKIPALAANEFSATFDTYSRLDIAYGDSWTSAWCDNDRLFVSSDDTHGIDGTCVSGPKGYNVGFGEILSSQPTDPLSGQAQNCMSAYGAENQTWSSPLSSSSCYASWKAVGLSCIGNTLYLTVSRQIYGGGYFGNQGNPACTYPWQKSMDASIISSNDFGASWSQTPPLNNNDPTVQFPGFGFGAPAFIGYGRGMNLGPADGARRYVYMISNDGYWANGTTMYLARASRSADLQNRANWQYLTSTPAPSWGPQSQAIPILESTVTCSSNECNGHFGVSQAQYIPSSNGAPGVYILPQWYYPTSDMHTTKWAFYSSPTPWGPWTKMSIGTDGDGLEKAWPTMGTQNQGYYNPTFVPKWIGDFNATTGTRDLWILFAGYPGNPDPNPNSYRLQRMHVLLTYPNLIANGGFEDQWQTFGAGAITNVSPNTGIASAQVASPSDGVARFLTGLVPGHSYRLSGFAFVTNPNDGVAIGAENPDASGEVWAYTSNTSYSPLSTVFTPSGTTAQIWCWKWWGTSTAYCDDLSLNDLAQLDVNLLANRNGGFEDNWNFYGSAAIVNNNARSGQFAGLVTSSTDGIERRISGLKPGRRYTISGFAEVTNPDDGVAIGARNPDGSGKVLASTSSTSYAPLSATFTASSSSALIWCWKWWGSSNAYCDDLRVDPQ
jgi:hypothetical protein